MNDLISNIGKVHTTEMGIERIKRNLSLEIAGEDVVEYCKGLIIDKGAVIESFLRLICRRCYCF